MEPRPVCGTSGRYHAEPTGVRRAVREEPAGGRLGRLPPPQKRHAPSLAFTNEVGGAVRKVEAGTLPKVAFVIWGWRWYPPEWEARYLLRLRVFCIEPASL
jgi:hypothetical protein